MTFDLPDLTPLIVPFVVALALAATLVAGVVAAFLVRNHAVRVRRHEPVGRYYAHLLLGH
jgi:hypothetical protein